MNVTIIADASHCPDTLAAGYGYWIACERGKEGGGGLIKGQVDNSCAAEMFAVCNALFIAADKGLVQPDDRVLIQTDCQAAILAFENRRKPATKHERAAISYFHKVRIYFSLAIEFRHVKGHSSQFGARYTTNRLCDRRARVWMKAARKAHREQQS